MNGISLRESKTHGRLTFPYVVYKSVIPEFLISYPLHWHDEMEIIYVRSGAVNVTVQTRRFTVTDGEILLIMPQTVHAIERCGDNAVEYYNVLFNFSLLNYSENDPCYEKYFKPLYNHTKRPPSLAQKGERLNDLLLPHILYLIDNRARSADDELMIKSHLFAVMSIINANAAPTSAQELSLKNNYDKLKNLLIRLQSNYGDELTVEAAAKLCSYSTSHFMKLFKELTGKSFTRYLIDYRLETAAKQLAETNAKITDIAAGVGFNNMSYFTRAFAANYGKSPSEYRALAHSETANAAPPSECR